MQKFIAILAFVLVTTLGVVSSAQANTTFDVSLGYGSANTTEVFKLQNFLFDLGYLRVSPTGAYLSLTQKAVAEFQASEGVSPTSGYFGPLTRAVANEKILAMSETSSPVNKASVSAVSVRNTTGSTASVFLANSKNITWQTSDYPANAGVNINLLRKTNDNPQTFVLVRSIVKDTANDGTETWIPQNGETSGDLYIEVTCSNTYNFVGGCQLSGQPARAN